MSGQPIGATRRAGAQVVTTVWILTGLSVIELGALVFPMRLPVVVVSLALIPLGLAAAVALWQVLGPICVALLLTPADRDQA